MVTKIERDAKAPFLPVQDGLAESDWALLVKIAGNLPLLADLSRSDIMLFVPVSRDVAAVIGEGRSNTVTPIYSESQIGVYVSKAADPAVFNVLAGSRPAQRLHGSTARGAPTAQTVYPLKSQGRVIAALSIEANLFERERQRRKSIVFRSAVAQLLRMVLRGLPEGGSELSRMGEHDGSLVVDSHGRIIYISSIAENLYRKLGYTTSLLGQQMGSLSTNESLFFEALDGGRCVEQVVQEGHRTWLKKAIPLIITDKKNWLWRMVHRTPLPAPLAEWKEIEGVLLVVRDITDESRKEQELRIKSVMIREIHHRMKNNLQTIAALLRLQARRSGSAAITQVLHQTINRIVSIAAVHESLSHDSSAIVDIKEVGQRILNEVSQGMLGSEKRIKFHLEGPSIYLPSQQATSCALIINELLQNAVEHGYPPTRSGYHDSSGGTIRVRLREGKDQYAIEVADDGCGLAADFDINRQGSLGLQIVTTLVKDDLKGDFELLDSDGPGTRAIVTFPKLQSPISYVPPAVAAERPTLDVLR